MIPEKLKIGDEIRIVAPSRSLLVIPKENVNLAKARLESLGFKVTFGKHVMDIFDDDYKCASIEDRLSDLHNAFQDKNVKCILCAIGGFNSNQLLDYIDYDLIISNPKIFCGYSDITALANAIYAKTGLITYSGPFFSSFAMKEYLEYTIEYFRKMLMQSNEFMLKPSKYWSNDPWYKDQTNRILNLNDGMFIINEGTANGTIVGGNICTLNALRGSEYMPNLDESILFIEDDEMCGDDFLKEFDRDLQALLHSSKGKNIKAIVLGRAEISCNMSREKWSKIIKTKKELNNIPVIGDADFGHTTPNFTFPIGGHAKIEAKGETIKLIIKG